VMAGARACVQDRELTTGGRVLTKMRGGLTYANVMATIAAFVALGGVGYAAVVVPPDSVGTKQLRNGAVIGSKVKDQSLTRADIDISKLGVVPAASYAGSASRADHANTADTASAADTANTATSADTATTANTATTAGHATTADTATIANGLAAPEGFHTVGTTGNPVFATGCQNLGSPYETVAFYKDREGVVHLKGEFDGCSTHDVFALPAGYRPATGAIQEFSGTNVTVYGTGVTSGYDGMVLCSVGLCSLDGITFRAGS
jgi:hypothetical protein